MNTRGLRRLCYLILAALLLVTGCSMRGGEELLRVPQPPRELRGLYEAVKSHLSSGMSYASPQKGDNRQSIQLRDLDGDGVDEALVFLRSAEELWIMIYVQDGDGVYHQATERSSIGDNIESVAYTDLNRDGLMELVVLYAMNKARAMSVYSFYEQSLPIIYESQCTTYALADITGTGADSLLLISLNAEPTETVGGEVRLLAYEDDWLAPVAAAHLSSGVSTIERIVTGSLRDGKQALFITGSFNLDENNKRYVHDVICGDAASIRNIALDPETGTARVKDSARNAANINADPDGIVEVPVPVTLPAYNEDMDPRTIIRWMSYDSAGVQRLELTTYHTANAGWYWVIPELWTEDLTIGVEGGSLTGLITIFARYGGVGQPHTEYVRFFTGENIGTEGRIVLSDATVKVAAEIQNNSISPETLAENFNIIQSEWLSGVSTP